MRSLIALVLACLPVCAAAQDNVELVLFGAMLERTDGTPLATATSVAGEPGAVQMVTGFDAATSEGACVKVRNDGNCIPIGNVRPLPGYERLAIVEAAIPQEEFTAKFQNLRVARQPLVGTYDPASDGGLTFLTQSALGGWLEPIALATVTGRVEGALVFQNDGFSALSVGAPLVHPSKGLVGIAARAGPGAASMLPMPDLIAALDVADVAVPDNMRPAQVGESGLPPRVESEMGRIIVFGDYSYIGNLSGFYAPSGGTGFDAGFVTDIQFSVWELDPSSGAARRIAGGDKALPLNPVGMSLEARFSGTPGDHLASCVVHATPTSGGRPVFALQFWRDVPERYNPNIDDKSYDEAATPLTGWAEARSPCATALGTVDEVRLAALAGRAPRAEKQSTTAVPSQDTASEPTITANQWNALNAWPATGRQGFTRGLANGFELTVGCTNSGELAASVAPIPGQAEFSLNGQPATDTGRTANEVYAFLPDDTGGLFRVIIDANAYEEALPQGLVPCIP